MIAKLSPLSLITFGLLAALGCAEEADPATTTTTAADRMAAADDDRRGHRDRDRGPRDRLAKLDTDGDGAISDAERAAAHQARAAEVFARLDVDGDGKVTATEWDAAPGRGHRRPALADLDRDGDGALSLEELRAHQPPRRPTP